MSYKSVKVKQAMIVRSSQNGEDHEVIVKENKLIYEWLFQYRNPTRSNYERGIGEFFSFLEGLLIKDLKTEHVVLYLETKEDKENATYNFHRAVLASMVSYMNKVGYLKSNPLAAVRVRPSKTSFYSKILTIEQVRDMMRAAKTERNALILEFLYMTGVRVSELCNLKWSDFRFKKDYYIVNCLGKGSVYRALKISSKLYEKLTTLRCDDADYVFYSKRHRTKVTVVTVWRVIKELSERADIPFQVSPHILRHTHATHAIEKGVPIHVLKQSLGHRSIKTTELYLHANPDDFSGDNLEI